ncbi:MAG: carboxypeptidase-like regulatory domain-containing protein, partial [Catalinimonas sp.]
MRLLVALLLLPLAAFAQPPTQTLRGRVVDAVSLQPLADVTVALPGTAPALGTTTDSAGTFRLSGVPVGRYRVRLSRVGWETHEVADLLLEAGKEQVLDVRLRERTAVLAALVVDARREVAPAPVSVRSIAVEETRRFPATFQDPARLAALYPGVVAANDQGNALVVRGNSPNGVLWRLEDVDIVNPNHLSNTGTLSDRPTFNGGGVNILSAQLLDNSYFLTGAFPAGYGNALGGVFDMRLRRGNDEHHEFTVQAGLLGIDLAAEGPFSANGKASFLVNYRYSTLGLLGALGVELGDEAIAFQDLSFNVTLPAGRAGTFTLFGMGGTSRNDFEAQRDTTIWEFEKDRFDIRFDSRMGALGATHDVSFGEKTSLRTSLAASAVENERTGARLAGDFSPQPLEYDRDERAIAA